MEPCVHQDIATLGGVGAKMNAQIAIRTITACDYLRKGIREGRQASLRLNRRLAPLSKMCEDAVIRLCSTTPQSSTAQILCRTASKSRVLTSIGLLHGR